MSDVQEFFSKMDYEGGAYGALQYGLRAEGRIPTAMREDWEEIVDAFEELGYLVDLFRLNWELSSDDYDASDE